MTLTGPATQAQYETALHSVTFSSTSDDPTNSGANASRTITWAVKDTLNIESGPVTSTINVTAVNDAPALQNVATAAYLENGAPASFGNSVTVTNPDGGPAYSATIVISGGFVAGDMLAVSGAGARTIRRRTR